MSLRSKFLWVLAALIAVYLALGHALLRGVFEPAFASLETRAVQDNVARIEHALALILDQINTSNSNWSWWSEAYAFARDPHDDFVRKYFYDDFHTENDVSLVVFFDASGARIWGKCFDLEKKEVLPLDELLGKPFSLDPAFLAHDGPLAFQTGFLRTRHGPMALSSRPVHDSAGNGPSAGTIVMGRFLDAQVLERVHRHTQVAFDLLPVEDASLPRTLRAAPEAPKTAPESVVQTHAQDLNLAYKLYRDERGAPAFVLRVETPREITRTGAQTVHVALLALAGAGILLTSAIWILLQRVILAPIAALTRHIVRLRSERDLARRIGLLRDDELGTLAEQFDGLTGELETASRVKSEFLATMSHEIRTPLNGVLGLTEMLLRTPLRAQQRHFAEGIERSAATLLSLLNDVLDFSKLEAGKLALEPSDFDLRALLEEVALLFAGPAHAKDLELVCDLAPDLDAGCRGDAGRLRQVLVNLMGNAVKFTETGEVALCAGLEAGGHVRFAVQDSGVGIEPAQQQRIFESFVQGDASHTRRFAGAGLGLAISKQLVERMGGHLEVQSDVGRGACFGFCLPLGAVSPGEGPREGASSGVREARVLVVEPNARSRAALLRQLRAWKVPCAQAEDAAEALASLRAAADARAPFEVALLAHQPPRLDALALAHAIRAEARLAATTLVTLSSVPRLPDDAESARLALGARLVKPVLRAHLYQCLTTLGAGDEAPGSPLLAATAARDVLGAPRPDDHGARGRDLARADADAPPDRETPLGGRVLLVEDDAAAQQLGLAMLEKLGCTVALAGDGHEALAALAESDFDLVLLDCRMPRMDGAATVREIRARQAARDGGRRIPIVALTASAEPSERAKCLAAGMDDFLAKPCRRAQLREMLARWLEPCAPRP